MFLWVEQYRPKTVDDCILPQSLKNTFKEFVANGNVPNVILSGGPGVGKTTIAKAVLEELGATYMMINGSEESGIDVLRNKIKNFASTVSMDGKRKYVILDEADYLNPQSTQPALRGFIEEFSKNCGFILTCNFKNRIIEPLHSRCSSIEFRIPNEEKPQLAMDFMNRCEDILQKEEGLQNKDEFRVNNIEEHHRHGTSQPIFIQGPPGTGKTFLASNYLSKKLEKTYKRKSDDDWSFRGDK